jgi:hypothetical protein
MTDDFVIARRADKRSLRLPIEPIDAINTNVAYFSHDLSGQQRPKRVAVAIGFAYAAGWGLNNLTDHTASAREALGDWKC